MKKFVLIAALLVFVGVVIFSLMPQVERGPELSLRAACKINLKQIGLALHNYHDEYGTFPPAYLVDDSGKPAHSWRVLVLPFLDQQALYERYRFDEPWNGPNNSKLAAEIPQVFRCPRFAWSSAHQDFSDDQLAQLTSYVAITGSGTIFEGETGIPIREVSDGLTNTIAVAEVCQHSIHWMKPQDVTASDALFDLQAKESEGRGIHAHGLHFLFSDGSVRYLSSGIDPKTFHALTTRNGDEAIDEF